MVQSTLPRKQFLLCEWLSSQLPFSFSLETLQSASLSRGNAGKDSFLSILLVPTWAITFSDLLSCALCRVRGYREKCNHST